MSKQKGAGLGSRGDDFYQLLIGAHEGLDFEQSAALNARLILLFAEEIGDFEQLERLVKDASSA